MLFNKCSLLALLIATLSPLPVFAETAYTTALNQLVRFGVTDSDTLIHNANVYQESLDTLHQQLIKLYSLSKKNTSSQKIAFEKNKSLEMINTFEKKINQQLGTVGSALAYLPSSLNPISPAFAQLKNYVQQNQFPLAMVLTRDAMNTVGVVKSELQNAN